MAETMINIFVTLLFVAILVAFYAVYRLGHYIGQNDERLSNLTKEVADYKERINNLEHEVESSKPKNHTHKTIACLEDAIAVILDAEFTADELLARLNTARRILGDGRQGPYSYDENRPSGKRK